jgi:superoxide dismutase
MIISCALAFVWFLQSKQTKAAQDLSIDMAVTRIDNKEFKEALFKQSSVEFTDMSGNKFVTKIGSDPTRELLTTTVNEFNKQNPGNKILTNEEEASSGLGWLVLIRPLASVNRKPNCSTTSRNV